MAQKYYSIVTDRGLAAISNAAVLGQKVDIIRFAVGDGGGTYYQPMSSMTELKGEVWRGNIARYEIDDVSDNVIAVTAILPSEIGGFTIREMGVFDDVGTMIAVCNTPDLAKAVVEDGISSEMEISMKIAVSNTDAVSFEVDPTVIIATKRNLEQHNEAVDAHREQMEKKADASLANVSNHDFKEKYEEAGLGNFIIIPQDEEISVDKRKANTIYFQVTNKQSTATTPGNIRVSPNMGIKLEG